MQIMLFLRTSFSKEKKANPNRAQIRRRRWVFCSNESISVLIVLVSAQKWALRDFLFKLPNGIGVFAHG
jgi:hypothetical protein